MDGVDPRMRYESAKSRFGPIYCRRPSASLWYLVGSCLIASMTIIGCSAINQVRYDAEHTEISLGPNDLEEGGIGFLTPSAATGREADKQALAMGFAKKLQEMRPDVRVVQLPDILSAVNAVDLDEEYKQTYRDYRETGILDGSMLRRFSELGSIRYFAQLSLASFTQGSRGRFSFFGLAISHTASANMRVFIQIWDAHNAKVAWEGFTELNYAYETSAEKPVTFHDVAELAAEKMFLQLPKAEDE
jgi:hypothetical protein